MKTNHEENIEKFYNDEDKKIRFYVILFLIVLISFGIVSGFFLLRDIKKVRELEVKTYKKSENKTLQNSELSEK